MIVTAYCSEHNVHTNIELLFLPCMFTEHVEVANLVSLLNMIYNLDFAAQ